MSEIVQSLDSQFWVVVPWPDTPASHGSLCPLQSFELNCAP